MRPRAREILFLSVLAVLTAVAVGLVARTCEPATFDYSGTVQSPLGTPAHGAVVVLYRGLSTSIYASTTCDVNGAFSFTGITDSFSVYKVVATRWNPDDPSLPQTWQLYTRMFVVPAGEKLTVEGTVDASQVDAPGLFRGMSRFANMPDRNNYGYCSFYVNVQGTGSPYAFAESLAAWRHYIGFVVKSDSVGRPGFMTWEQLREVQGMGHEIIMWLNELGSLYVSGTWNAIGGCGAVRDSLKAEKDVFVANGVVPTMLAISPYTASTTTTEDSVHCGIANQFDYCIWAPIGIEGWCNYSPPFGERACVYGMKNGSGMPIEEAYSHNWIDRHNIMAGSLTSFESFTNYACSRWFPRGHWALYYCDSPSTANLQVLKSALGWCDSMAVTVTRPTDGARICFAGRQYPPAGSNLFLNGSFVLDMNRDSLADGDEQATHGIYGLYFQKHIKSGIDGPSGDKDERWLILYGEESSNPAGTCWVEFQTMMTGVKPRHRYEISWKERGWYHAVTGKQGGKWGPVVKYQRYYPHQYDEYGIISGSLTATADDTLWVYRDSTQMHGRWVEMNGGRAQSSPYFTFLAPDSITALSIKFPLYCYCPSYRAMFDSLEIADVQVAEVSGPEEGGFATLRTKSLVTECGGTQIPEKGRHWVSSDCDTTYIYDGTEWKPQ